MARRHHMSGHHSRRNFRHGSGVHRKNLSPPPMRGGIRL